MASEMGVSVVLLVVVGAVALLGVVTMTVFVVVARETFAVGG